MDENHQKYTYPSLKGLVFELELKEGIIAKIHKAITTASADNREIDPDFSLSTRDMVKLVEAVFPALKGKINGERQASESLAHKAESWLKSNWASFAQLWAGYNALLESVAEGVLVEINLADPVHNMKAVMNGEGIVRGYTVYIPSEKITDATGLLAAKAKAEEDLRLAVQKAAMEAGFKRENDVTQPNGETAKQTKMLPVYLTPDGFTFVKPENGEAKERTPRVAGAFVRGGYGLKVDGIEVLAPTSGTVCFARAAAEAKAKGAKNVTNRDLNVSGGLNFKREFEQKKWAALGITYFTK